MAHSFDICPRCNMRRPPRISVSFPQRGWYETQSRVGYRQGFGCGNPGCCFDFINGSGAYQFNIPEEFVVISHPTMSISYIHLISSFRMGGIMLHWPKSIAAWTNSDGSIAQPTFGTIIELKATIPVDIAKDNIEKMLLLI